MKSFRKRLQRIGTQNKLVNDALGIGFETLRGAGASWRAGSVYYADILAALRAHYADSVRLLLVEAQHGTPVPDELKPLAENVIGYPTLRRFRPTWAIEHARHRLFKHDLLPDRVLKEKGVDVLVCGVLERHTSLPTLALLPDFQHVHLPELFEPNERAWRDREFAKTAARATRILVFSETVRADLQNFAPPFAHKARVLPPVTCVPASVYERDPREILETYSLPEKFVYLPNQLWQHKNHLLAFQAVRALKARGENIFIVCTGNLGDSRNTNYVSELVQSVSRWGIRENVALLGNVPRADVFTLMRQAAFVLNPSRFEGYGLSLAEARAVGKRVLASDLPAHREQAVPDALYFESNNLGDLTEKLGALWHNTTAGPDSAREAQARQTQPARVRAYAEQWFEMIGQVLS